MTTPPLPPRPSMLRTSLAIALKDYTFIRPGIAVSISAACLIAALIIGTVLIGSLKRASAIVDLGSRTVFTLHGYNAALEAWHELVTSEDPTLKRPESVALRDRLRTALTGQLQELQTKLSDSTDQALIGSALQGLATMDVGLDNAARQAMIVVLARQDAAMFAAVAASQRAVLLAAVLMALTLVAAGTLVVPMAWLYIRYKRGITLRVPA